MLNILYKMTRKSAIANLHASTAFKDAVNAIAVVARLIEEALAACRAAKARNTIRTFVFALELVVVGEFFVCKLLVSMIVYCVEVKFTHSWQCP